ncbi:hypothetical protein SEA_PHRAPPUCCINO_171 [Mycobacterium phage Phrappuccino]|uniref:Uncharacterized protein n=1 Tax=Mycobacterium phage Phrappuccino TaxID=2591223 RepID=A0A514DE08_9CAUD|nr:hypothetical protein KHQ87_gp171 [Mycobacterium phage Phrappuccino]QDH91846.1 hypothetical protein SEA_PHRAPPUCCINO_171 [Mycobacterium phage Phrappuccino]QIQ63287.1 hypothetical protein SEA_SETTECANDELA_171 [Mycobacterium phage Settecandela]
MITCPFCGRRYGTPRESRVHLLAFTAAKERCDEFPPAHEYRRYRYGRPLPC